MRVNSTTPLFSGSEATSSFMHQIWSPTTTNRDRYLVANFAGGGKVQSYTDAGTGAITLTDLYPNVGIGILSMAQDPTGSSLYVTLGPENAIKKINLSSGVQVNVLLLYT